MRPSCVPWSTIHTVWYDTITTTHKITHRFRYQKVTCLYHVTHILLTYFHQDKGLFPQDIQGRKCAHTRSQSTETLGMKEMHLFSVVKGLRSGAYLKTQITNHIYTNAHFWCFGGGKCVDLHKFCFFYTNPGRRGAPSTSLRKSQITLTHFFKFHI
jgi:hypothetical protein